MRLCSLPAAALCAAICLLSSSPFTSASPVAARVDEQVDGALQNSTLVARCANPCGWSGQLCCQTGTTCITNSDNEAECIASSGGGVTAAGSGGGYWATYTTTWVETGLITRTAVYSSYVGGSPVTGQSAPTGTAQCDYAADETPCGSICCASGQYCYALGQCVDAGNGGYTTDQNGATVYVPGGTMSGTFSAPLRPTTGTFTVVTATVSPTTTVPFQTPVATGESMGGGVTQSSGGGGGGLSGGAIAGIVIGVLVGLALLALLCFCCIVRGLWAIVAGIFGLGRKKRTRVEETYVSEHRHGSVVSGSGRVWYGDRPGRPDRPEKKSRFGGIAAMAAGLGALGLGLAGKRAYDRRKERRDEKSDVSSSYYYGYSDYTSTSSPSTVTRDRSRTRRTSRR